MPTRDDIDRHRRAQDLFLDALDVPPDERADWLDTHCPDDLRSDVDSLLDAHTGSGILDETPHGTDFFDDDGERRDPMLGQEVGPWRLESRLGVGGMGTVYRAVRADGLYERTVAVKLLRLGADAETLGQRLRGERQILARLEHPRIARLYDGGVTDDGLPFLVLELVDGEELTAYVERHEPSVDERLRLFLDVCDAVAYAHRNLVVHRDLKPSNILVTDDGEVKLLDFGIAKLTEGDEDDVRTRTASRLMTPAYAAPEQLTGAPITTATDVYSLGVVLYELLVGQRPYDLDGKTASEMERIVCETEPAKPSTAVHAAATDAPGKPSAAEATPERRARRLRGDLDTIVLKALAKEPERRYPGAEALAADLRSHLDGLPVTARPATTGYRVRKFVQRHRAGVVAASLVALALVVGLGAALWQGRVAAMERDRTAAALMQAEGTLSFLEDTILMGDPQQGDPNAPLSAVLDSAAARVDAEADPAVAGAIHTSLANVYLGRGLPERAEHHARRALAVVDPDSRRAGWAHSALAQALADSGFPADAEPHHQTSIRLLRASDMGDDTQLAIALNIYGTTLFALDRPDEAEAAYREALAIERRLNDPEAATTLNNLAVLVTQQGRNEEGAALLGEMVEDLRRREGPAAAYQRSFALMNWAGALSNLGRADSALALYREGVASFVETLGEEHPETIAAQTSLAFHLHRMERFDDAGQIAARALVTAEDVLGLEHPYTAYAQNVSGMTYCDGGAPERGAPLLRASLTTRRAMLPEGHWILANGESLLGGCVLHLGRRAEAERLLRSGYENLRISLGDDHLRTTQARDRLRALDAEPVGPSEAAPLPEGE